MITIRIVKVDLFQLYSSSCHFQVSVPEPEKFRFFDITRRCVKRSQNRNSNIDENFKQCQHAYGVSIEIY